MRLSRVLCILVWLVAPFVTWAAVDPFRQGVNEFESGAFAKAVTNFSIAAEHRPASGTLVNLGLAEWRRGRAGAAVVAWERALWIEPANGAARNNLRYEQSPAESSGAATGALAEIREALGRIRDALS